MILLLTTLTAMAENAPVVTHLQSRSYRMTDQIVVVSQDKEILSAFMGSSLETALLPKIGNIQKEIGRLQNKHGTRCIVQVEKSTPPNEAQPVDTNSTTDDNNENSVAEETPSLDVPKPTIIDGYSIVDVGTCTIDETMRYTIKDNGSLWSVIDNQSNPVSVEAFANVCEDIPLLLRLELEDEIATRNGNLLKWGGTALGIGGLFTLGNPDPGFSAREQNHFWTGVFLFGTAAMLWTQRDMPFVYKTDRQDDLSNYHSRKEVERLLLKTFGEEPSTETDALESTIDNTTDVSTDTDDDAENKSPDETVMQESAPTEPTTSTTPDTATETTTPSDETPSSAEPNPEVEQAPEQTEVAP